MAPPVMGGCLGDTATRRQAARVEDRAMSLRTLRHFHEDMKVLCNSGLVYETSGSIVPWPTLNQYTICDEIIKPVLLERGLVDWSWSEATGGACRAHVFVCHCWVTPFREFMMAVECHATEHKVRSFQGYWICVYANRQLNLELGSSLETSPFFEAHLVARLVLLVLDKVSSALGRVWCVFEIHETLKALEEHQQEQPCEGKHFHVATHMGLVGGALVSSGPVVSALQTVDVADAKATVASDQAMILNHIAGKWLKKEPGRACAAMAHVRGLRKGGSRQFQDTDEMTDEDKADVADALRGVIDTATSPAEGTKKLRRSGLERFYVAECLSCFKDAFVELSSSISERCAKMPEMAHQEGAAVPKAGLEIGQRGITLSQFRTLANEVKHAYARDWGELTIREFYSRHVAGVQAERGVSYVESIAPSPQEPDVICNSARDELFSSLVRCVEWHAEARRLPDTTVYFIPVLAEREVYDVFERAETLEAVMRGNSVAMLLNTVDDDARIMSSTLCGGIIHLARERSLHVDFACATGIISHGAPFPGTSGWEVGCFSPKVARSMLEKRIGDSDSQQDREHWLGKIREHSSLEEFDAWAHQCVCFPCLRDAVMRGREEGPALLQGLVAQHGFDMRDYHLLGLGGLSLLHVAAMAEGPPGFSGSESRARNISAIIGYLVAQGLDVHAADQVGNTPLHVAALSGNLAAVRALVGAGASTERRNFGTHTPLDFASYGRNRAKDLRLDCQLSGYEDIERALGPTRRPGLRHMAASWSWSRGSPSSQDGCELPRGLVAPAPKMAAWAADKRGPTLSFHRPETMDGFTPPYDSQTACRDGCPNFATVNPGDETLFVGGGALNGAIGRTLAACRDAPLRPLQNINAYQKLHESLALLAGACPRGTLVPATPEMVSEHGSLQWSGCRLFEGEFLNFGAAFVHIFRAGRCPFGPCNVGMVYTVGPLGQNTRPAGEPEPSPERQGCVFEDPDKFGGYLRMTSENIARAVAAYNGEFAGPAADLPRIEKLRVPLVSGGAFRHPRVSKVECAVHILEGISDAAMGGADLEVNCAYDASGIPDAARSGEERGCFEVAAFIVKAASILRSRGISELTLAQLGALLGDEDLHGRLLSQVPRLERSPPGTYDRLIARRLAGRTDATFAVGDLLKFMYSRDSGRRGEAEATRESPDNEPARESP